MSVRRVRWASTFARSWRKATTRLARSGVVVGVAAGCSGARGADEVASGSVLLATGLEVVSVSAAGNSLVPRMCGDGSAVVFVSGADNLVPNDSNQGRTDVFWASWGSGEVRLVSVNRDGASGNGPSSSPVVSRDGRWVAFVSDASDLVPGDTNGVADVFLRDVVAGVTRLVSAGAAGQSADAESAFPAITPDGRWVAFESRATNLVPGDLQRLWDVFLFDAQSGTVRRLSQPSAVASLSSFPTGDSQGAVLSEDGATVAFSGTGLNLAPGFAAGPVVLTNDLYVWRAPAGTNRMVNLVPESVTSAVAVTSRNPALSADGRYLAAGRMSSATNRLAMGFFRVDLETGEGVRVDEVGRAFPFFRPGQLANPLLSADGGAVVFETRTEIPVGANDWRAVVYVWEASGRQATLVSSGGWLEAADGSRTELPWGDLLGASRDAGFVAFRGGNTNEPPGSATNQIQVRHRLTGELRRVSRTRSGGPTLDNPHPAVSFSDDGRRLAFQSDDSDLVEGDRNRAWDVFVYDWESDSIRLVSRASELRLATTGPGSATLGRSGSVLSADGRWLAFASSSADLVKDLADTNRCSDVFVRDLRSGTNRLVSVRAEGGAAGRGRSYDAAIDESGRWVAFVSFASDLVPGDTNRADDVFLRDLTEGSTRLVSRGPLGVPVAGSSRRPVFSPDGARVAFESEGALVAGDRNGKLDVYLYEIGSGRVTLVSRRAEPPEAAGAGASGQPTFSPDGRWLAFETEAADLPPVVVARGRRVLAVDLLSGATVSLTPSNVVPGGFFPGSEPVAAFSPDGRYVALGTTGKTRGAGGVLYLRDLVEGEVWRVASEAIVGAVGPGGSQVVYRDLPVVFGGGPAQVRIWDRSKGTSALVTVGSGGAPGDGRSGRPGLTSDGRFVVFTSAAGNLVADDHNGASDLFIRDVVRGETLRIGGSASTMAPILGGDGRTVVFASAGDEWEKADLNRDFDVFLLRLPGVESGFRVAEIRRLDGGGGVTLAWAARDGQAYRVEATEDLGAPWVALPVPVRVEAGRGLAEDSTVAGGGRRFYRVVETPGR